MRCVAALGDRGEAYRKARRLQQNADRGVLFGVEHDAFKQPWPYRVICVDLNDPRDRAQIGPAGTQRVTGVTRTMWARSLSLIIATPKPTDPIGEYKAKRAAKRRASKQRTATRKKAAA